MNGNFTLQCSRSLKIYCYLLYFSALTLIFSLPLAVKYQLFLIFLLGCDAYYFLWRWVDLNSPTALINLAYSPQFWQLTRRDGEVLLGSLITPIFVSQNVIVLRFRLLNDNTKVRVMIWPDSLPAGKYRELLILLKYFTKLK